MRVWAEIFLDLSNDGQGSMGRCPAGVAGGGVGGVGLPPGWPAPPVCCGGVEPGGGGAELPLPGLSLGGPPLGGTPPLRAPAPPGCALPVGLLASPPPDPLPPSPDPSGGPPPADLGRVCRGVHCIGYTAAFAAGLLLQPDDGGGGGGDNLLDGT